MRLGISTSLGRIPPKDWAAKLTELGCRAAVFPVDHTAGEELCAGYASAAKDAGIPIAEVGVWRNVLAKDGEARKAARDYAKAQLRLADAVGASCCVNIAGAAGEIWDGAYRENYSADAWDTTVESVREIIDDVRPKNTYYTIEPMPWMIPSNPDEYLRLIHAVDRERFAVHMDICNWITDPRKYFFSGDFIEEAFGKLGGHIRSCHLKDVALAKEFTTRLIETHCGGGEIDLEAYARAANASSKDMPMIIEHLHSDDEYERSLAYVRDRFAAAGLVVC